MNDIAFSFYELQLIPPVEDGVRKLQSSEFTKSGDKFLDKHMLKYENKILWHILTRDGEFKASDFLHIVRKK